MNYPNMIRLEEEIKILLEYRLAGYQYNEVIVEAYYAMDMSAMCRIELFSGPVKNEHRIAKYEAELKEGFYYEAEQNLMSQMEPKTIKKAS